MATIIIEACGGCNKIRVRGNALETCKAYANPASRHRVCRCPLHSVSLATAKKTRKVNPLKASKRG